MKSVFKFFIKIVLSIFIFIIVAVSLIVGFYYLNPDKIPVQMEKGSGTVVIHTIEEQAVYGNAIINIINQTPFDLKTGKINWLLMLHGKPIAKSSIEKEYKINKRTTDYKLKIPFRIEHKKFFDIWEEMQGDSVEAEFRSDVFVRIPGGKEIKIPVNFKEAIYLPIRPDVSIEDIKIVKPGLRKFEIIAKVKIENKDEMFIQIKKIDYNLKIGKDITTSGVLEKNIDLTKKQTIVIDVPVDLQIDGFPDEVISLLFKSKNLQYQIDGKIFVIINFDQPQKATVKFSTTGKVEELKEATKIK